MRARPTFTRLAASAALSLITCFVSKPVQAAVPSTFTYQGSLKQNGIPVNGNYSMEFRLTNASGSQVYWTSGVRTVGIQEGLYRTDLSPTNVNWTTADPHLEIKLNGATLTPRERLTSALYAVMARELDAGAVAKGQLTVSGKLMAQDVVETSSDVVVAGSLSSQGRLSAANDIYTTGKIGIGIAAPSARLSILDTSGQTAGNTNTLFGSGYSLGSVHGNRQFWIQQWLNTQTARTFLVGNGYVSGTTTPVPNDGPYTPFQGIEFNDSNFGFVWNNGGTISPAVVVNGGGNVAVGKGTANEKLDVDGRVKISGPIAGGLEAGDGPLRGTLRVMGDGDKSNGRLVILQGPWPNAWQTDRSFVVGYNVDGEGKFFIRGDGGYFASSSRHLKDDITPVESPIRLVSRISGVRYRWKGDERGKKTLGFIAEDLAQVLPDAVEDGKFVNYDAVIPVLVEAIKELAAEVEALKVGKR